MARGACPVNAVPRLSIGLPVYNGERYVAESIKALLGQSYEEFELIISDNASTDSTGDICREYVQQDSRIRYIRQPRNIGAAPNHNVVVGEARGELFKWAASDDLYDQDLLRRCIAALDERPDLVLAHSWTAVIGPSSQVTRLIEYPLDTASDRAPDRFRSLLLQDGGDDDGGVIRASVLRRVAPLGSFRHSDRTIMAELALYGPFYMVPDWLYFRREHPGRAKRANPTARSWCATMDPRRSSRLRHPLARLYGEYIWAYLSGIQRAPLTMAERRECWRYLMEWAASRALPNRPGPAPVRSRAPGDDYANLGTVAGWQAEAGRHDQAG
jgi:glycosyltransferase involved in cell wall biosynthesis